MWVLRTGALLEPGVDCGRRPQSPPGDLRQVPGAHEVEGGQQGLWMSPQVPPEVWAADDQDLLLLLEPEEFVRGAVQLTQVLWRGHWASTAVEGLGSSAWGSCSACTLPCLRRRGADRACTGLELSAAAFEQL